MPEMTKSKALADITKEMAILMRRRRSILAQPGTGAGDANDLMRAIATATVKTKSGDLVSIAEVTTDAAAYFAYSSLMEGKGVALTEGRRGTRSPRIEGKRFIFFDLYKVHLHLLSVNQGHGLDCERLLMRVPGADRIQRTVGRRRVWGIEVPLEEWKNAMNAPGTAAYQPAHDGGQGRLAFGRSGGIWADPSDCRPTVPPEPAPPPVARQLGALSMPSLGTQFGARVVGQATTLSLADFAPPPAHAAEPPPIRPDQVSEIARAIFEGFFKNGGLLTETAPTVPLAELKFLDLDQAATYSRLKQGTISNLISAGLITKEPGSGRVVIRREVIDTYLATKRVKKAKSGSSITKTAKKPKHGR